MGNRLIRWVPGVQTDVGQIGRLIQKGEAKLKEYQHPDPYIGEHCSPASHCFVLGQADTFASLDGLATPLQSAKTYSDMQFRTILAALCTQGTRPSQRRCISSWTLAGKTIELQAVNYYWLQCKARLPSWTQPCLRVGRKVAAMLQPC